MCRSIFTMSVDAIARVVPSPAIACRHVRVWSHRDRRCPEPQVGDDREQKHFEESGEQREEPRSIERDLQPEGAAPDRPNAVSPIANDGLLAAPKWYSTPASV
jgi:hypothetical protein